MSTSPRRPKPERPLTAEPHRLPRHPGLVEEYPVEASEREGDPLPLDRIFRNIVR
jgi:hypothetical protein